MDAACVGQGDAVGDDVQQIVVAGRLRLHQPQPRQVGQRPPSRGGPEVRDDGGGHVVGFVTEDIADGGVPVPDAQLDTELVRGGVGGESLKELLVRQGHDHVPSLISAALPEGDPPRS